jgi:hypothetical protein
MKGHSDRILGKSWEVRELQDILGENTGNHRVAMEFHCHWMEKKKRKD